MAESEAPPAVAATAQSDLPEPEPEPEPGPAAAAAEPPRPEPCPEEGRLFHVGEGVPRLALGKAYERQPGEPLYRPLRVFALDPAQSRLEGSVAVLRVPFEPVAPGPIGSIFAVEGDDGFQVNRPIDLDARAVLIDSGLEPSPSNPQFHQQMVYAVCSAVYATFRTALGRHIPWGFDQATAGFQGKLRLRPYHGRFANAYYDRDEGALLFGYFQAGEAPAGRTPPGGRVFTSLAHDIVVHEVTHALLDGLRSRFTVPTSPAVLAFHEAFADLVALFHRFSYRDVLERALRGSRGDPGVARVLTQIATQFGQTTTERGTALRRVPAVGEDGKPLGYDEEKRGRYELASVLVSAVFEAFLTVFRRKSRRYVVLATGGSGVLPEGELSPGLIEVLTDQAEKLAGQFLAICIRAIDYCPPVNVGFGDYLRALITADRVLAPEDPWGYREALIDACRERRIVPQRVDSLSEDALLWRTPLRTIDRAPGLSFSQLQFGGDPSEPAGPDELRRQACALGRLVTDPRFMDEFGLVPPGDPRLEGDEAELPRVESVRAARRAGPQGQIVFDLVAEVTQRRRARTAGGETFDFYGGSTVVIDPRGEVRYIISKHVTNAQRLEAQRRYVAGPGRALWEAEARHLRPRKGFFGLLHGAEEAPAVEPAVARG